MPWNSNYKDIILCAGFSYLLPSNTSSRLEVYRQTSSSKNLLWWLSGHQGTKWQRASIPLKSDGNFQIAFKGDSKTNFSISMAIRDFQVTSRSCSHVPEFAKPGFLCEVTKYKCTNGHCIDKQLRCNGIHGDCLDGSDEEGCACLTGYFTCTNQICIPHSKLCDGKRDCSDGEDERHCGEKKCPEHQCLDGTCSSCSHETQGQCEEKRHNPLCDAKKIVGCRIARAICDFDNDLCDFENDNTSTIFWDLHKPMDHQSKKHYFPDHDHTSLTDKGYYIVLDSRENTKSGQGRLLKHWITTPTSACMQFWYFIPDNSDSFLEIFVGNETIASSVWKTSDSTTGSWAFGQVQIPGTSTRKIIITGSVRKYFVALDDVGFVENGCASVQNQQKDFFRWEDSWSHGPKEWKFEDVVTCKYFHPEFSKDFSPWRQAVSVNSMHKFTITSPAIYPKAEGWKCFGFKFSSSEKYFERKITVEFHTETNVTKEWSYSSSPGDFNSIQLPLPENQERLQIKVKGQHYDRVVFLMSEFGFTKEHCLRIPAYPECEEYKTLSYTDRREDVIAEYEMFQGCDDHLFTTAWYRVVGSAGNQLSTSCITRKSSCSTKYMGWINGPLPSVDESVVERPLCFASGDECCVKETVVKIRNCKDYFVYQFPKKVPSCPSKYCTTYRLKNTSSDVLIEWKGWDRRRNKKVQWEVLNENSYEKVASSIKESNTSRGGSLTRDYRESDMVVIGFALSRKNYFIVEISEMLVEFTLCFWLSTNTSSPLKVKIDYMKEKESQNAATVAFAKVHGITSSEKEKWSHICVTWMSNFGVWQTYVDGALMHHGLRVLDKDELYSGSRISVTFNSQGQNTEVKYSRLNIWRLVLSRQSILYMSYTCETESGSLLGWKAYLSLLPRNSSDFKIYDSSCRGKQGSVLSVVNTSPHETPVTAMIQSPRYERSSSSSKRCLRFKYKVWGAGAKSLKIYQKLDDKVYTKRPIWMVKDNEDSGWKDGQVTLLAITAYKLVIEGETTNTPGLLSLGALRMSESNCSIIPRSAGNACNEILNNKTGYILSPYYPGFHSNNADCTWTIKGSTNQVIYLDFKAFDLHMSPQCSSDYLEVYDGDGASSSSRIGRYCGDRYPQLIQSQTNTIRIVFHSDNAIARTGFKIYYMIKDLQFGVCVQECPISCTCRRLEDGGIIVTSYQVLQFIPKRLPKKTRAVLFRGNQIYQVESNAFLGPNRHLSLVDLSHNRIFLVEEMSFVNLLLLKALRMNRNFIKEIQKEMFSGLERLEVIDFGQNLISRVGLDTFSDFPALRALSLRSNQLKELHIDTFQNNTNMTYLYLQDNAIQRIPAGIFRHQKNLAVLLLHKNNIERIDKSSFEGLGKLRKLTLRNNSINEQTVSRDVFDVLRKLEYLSTDSFIICCYATNSIPNLNCESPGNEFSSCSDMLKSIYVQICIWIEAFLAILGNVAVIVWWTFLLHRRGKTRRKINSVQSLLFCHLAIADFLMGVYLLIIGTYNELWKGEYFLHDVSWRAGVGCQVAGTIATLSSEVSVMILVGITADRMNTILSHTAGRRTSLKLAHVLCLFIWILGFIMSFTPLLVPTYFNDKISGFSFYGRSSVCLPLQLSVDRPAGWQYSVGIFIAFNGAAFLFIFIGYTAIFLKVRQTGRNVRKSSSVESSLGRRLLFVILTDFCCWMPIMVLGVLSLIGKFDDPAVYVWVGAFVLPINSAINPVLYTFSSKQTIIIFRSVKKKWRKNKGQKPHNQGPFFKTTPSGQTLLPLQDLNKKKMRPSKTEKYSLEARSEDNLPFLHKRGSSQPSSNSPEMPATMADLIT